MEIRLAVTGDAETVSELNNTVQALHNEALPHIFKTASTETFPASRIADLMADEENYFYLAFENNQPAGYIYVQILQKPETALKYTRDMLMIHQISVKQEFQKSGAGKMLIETALALANEKDITHIELDVWSFNENARDFFSRQGFTVFNSRMWLQL